MVGRFELVVLAEELVVLATRWGTVGDFHFYEVGDSRNPVGVGGQDLEAM